ncbi:MAG: hypothetical protein ACQESP_08395 [Candidatus Muiribacteriota bacterium]
MNKGKIKEFSKIAVFSSIWAVSEVFLGNYLHSVNLPMRGVILTALPVFLFSVGSFYFKTPLSPLKTGIIVALIRTIYSWKFNIFVTLAIMMQAVLANIILFLFSKSFFTPVLLGVFLQSWTYFQSYFMRVLFAGTDLKVVIDRVLDISFIQYFSSQIIIIFLIIYLIHILPGIVAGIVGYKIGKELSGNH